MTTQTLEQLLVLIEASTSGLRQELNKGVTDVASFGRKVDANVQRVETRFAKLGGSLRSAFAAFGVGLSVTGLVNFTRSAIQSADAIGETARAAGFGAERFQRLSFVFRQNGLSAMEFDAAMRTLNTRLGQFISEGAGPAAKAFERLGISQKIASGEIRTAEQAFEAISQAFGGIESSAERAALAAQFFGREAGVKLQDTLGRGADAINAAAEAASGIFTDDTVRKADELADAWERIAAAAGNYAKSAVVGAAHQIGRAVGVDELQPNSDEERASQLRQLRDSLLASNLTLNADEAAELSALEVKIRRDRARAAARQKLEGMNAAQRLQEGDGLSPIDVTAQRRPVTADVFQQWRQMWSDEGLKEASAAITKMPDDLKKLSPAFHTAVKALGQYNEGLDEAAERQRDLASTIGSAFHTTLAAAFMGVDRDFGTLLKSMLANLAASGLMNALSNILAGATGKVGSFFSLAFGGTRHSGGPVAAGVPYVVKPDEEIFVPDVAGRVKTMAQARSSGGGGGGMTLVLRNESGVQLQATEARQSGPGVYEVGLSLVQTAFGSGKMDALMKAKYGLQPGLGTR